MWIALLIAAAVSAEQAKQLVPRADLSSLTDAQRGVFIDVANDVFGYAGCQEKLARCLAADLKDEHALREAALVKQLVLEGSAPPAATIVEVVERYYDSFDEKKRDKPRTDNCAILGDPKAKITIVEFADFQCPHCAVSAKPLRDLVTGTEKGKARLCSKYFPWPMHARARIAAACAEYARAHGKFWEWSDTVFAHQEALEDDQLKGYAKSVGLDGDEMLKLVFAGKYDAAVESHIREGTALGIDSTPTLYVNGRHHWLPILPFYLQHSVDDELEWKKQRGFGKAGAVAAAQKPLGRKH
jgi:protein-disulfide isomerase